MIYHLFYLFIFTPLSWSESNQHEKNGESKRKMVLALSVAMRIDDRSLSGIILAGTKGRELGGKLGVGKVEEPLVPTPHRPKRVVLKLVAAVGMNENVKQPAVLHRPLRNHREAARIYK